MLPVGGVWVDVMVGLLFKEKITEKWNFPSFGRASEPSDLVYEKNIARFSDFARTHFGRARRSQLQLLVRFRVARSSHKPASSSLSILPGTSLCSEASCLDASSGGGRPSPLLRILRLWLSLWLAPGLVRISARVEWLSWRLVSALTAERNSVARAT